MCYLNLRSRHTSPIKMKCIILNLKFSDTWNSRTLLRGKGWLVYLPLPTKPNGISLSSFIYSRRLMLWFVTEHHHVLCLHRCTRGLLASVVSFLCLDWRSPPVRYSLYSSHFSRASINRLFWLSECLRRVGIKSCLLSNIFCDSVNVFIIGI